VLEKDPAIEAATLGTFSAGLEFDALPLHVMSLGQRPEHLQHIGQFRGQLLIRCRFGFLRLLGASMLALIYGLIEGSTAGWTAVPVLCLAAEPLILPALLAKRGFTSGLLLGLAFFAAVSGLAYVIASNALIYLFDDRRT
jgi:hypothetical protein